eukprot:GHRQ01022178.1.p3 GENE.GHRQ01022178.1~~GHRQ01022178.1.p3  ORF type:complete len:107 (-),score=19.57 GHRQ01022178.1:861-1181(-)
MHATAQHHKHHHRRVSRATVARAASASCSAAYLWLVWQQSMQLAQRQQSSPRLTKPQVDNAAGSPHNTTRSAGICNERRLCVLGGHKHVGLYNRVTALLGGKQQGA